MHATDYGTAILAACAIIALVGGIVAWFFKRGADERENVVALRDNTESQRELTQEFRGFRDSVSDILHQHDIRITKLEATQNGSTPANRDSGTTGRR